MIKKREISGAKRDKKKTEKENLSTPDKNLKLKHTCGLKNWCRLQDMNTPNFLQLHNLGKFNDFIDGETEQELKGEVKNHNHTASKTVILRKANLHSLDFVLLPLFLILHLAHFDFQARKLGHYRLAVKRQTKERRENGDGRT